jgi:lanosterol synthase
MRTLRIPLNAGLAEESEFHEVMIKALEFIDDAQFKEEVPNMRDCYRHFRKGAWGFSTREQGYTVADCTGEGLKATIYLQEKLEYANFDALVLLDGEMLYVPML